MPNMKPLGDRGLAAVLVGNSALFLSFAKCEVYNYTSLFILSSEFASKLKRMSAQPDQPSIGNRTGIVLPTIAGISRFYKASLAVGVQRW